ncbi:cell envelope integrity EipB family protein [Neorhizobium alkalisoli]|uniref:cell envelope integrity EipB family protein n=1 Tax=Neorhizobium alkalisoli TaxID=528178 RepID=UPI000CF972FA|nr:cell envelope integrity EipB family protein [Neorhizobium alkalisoli]
MLRMSLRVILAGGVSLLACVSADANSDSASRALVPHRAIYDLKLKDASERSGIEGMVGRMVYEFTGSACTGFSTSFRLVTKINTGEETRLSDQQTTTFEDMAARQFHFETKSFTDEQLDKQISGDASMAENGVKVEITQPDGREVDLPASVFPTGHMLDVIQNAKDGKNFFEARVFDGSEDGDKALLTTTVIGKRQEPEKDDVDADKAGEFSRAPFWPVTIAYFNEAAQGDPTPVYNMSFKLYENGVTRDLTMDYGDFVLSGSLTKLELLKQQQDPCPAPAK